jgi:hypothetical protein
MIGGLKQQIKDFKDKTSRAHGQSHRIQNEIILICHHKQKQEDGDILQDQIRDDLDKA